MISSNDPDRLDKLKELRDQIKAEKIGLIPLKKLKAQRKVADALLDEELDHLDLQHHSIIKGERRCSRCHKIQPISSFRKSTSNVGGFHYACKECEHKLYITPNLPKLNARTKAWNKANPEAAQIIRRRIKKQPYQRIRNSLKKRLARLMTSKTETLQEWIGCSAADFRRYMESHFQPGMTWANYGSIWEVDHILPLRAFDLTNKDQRMQANHYSNLKPEFKATNNRKSDLLPDGRRARSLPAGVALSFLAPSDSSIAGS